MGLYIDDMFSATGRVPGRIKILIPDYDPAKKKSYWSRDNILYGILNSEVPIGGQNKWGPILDDISNLTDFSSFMGAQEIFAWVGSSVQCWKGTDPLSFQVEFTLVNYKPGLNLEDKLQSLLKLASLRPTGEYDNTTGIATVVPHGGYAADVLKTNKGYFSSAVPDIKGLNQQAIDVLSNSDYYENGTVIIEIGSRYKIGNLLVNRCSFVPSLIEVAAESSKELSLPLYYTVSISFIGTHALLSTDVDNIFHAPAYDAASYY